MFCRSCRASRVDQERRSKRGTAAIVPTTARRWKVPVRGVLRGLAACPSRTHSVPALRAGPPRPEGEEQSAHTKVAPRSVPFPQGKVTARRREPMDRVTPEHVRLGEQTHSVPALRAGPPRPEGEEQSTHAKGAPRSVPFPQGRVTARLGEPTGTDSSRIHSGACRTRRAGPTPSRPFGPVHPAALPLTGPTPSRPFGPGHLALRARNTRRHRKEENRDRATLSPQEAT